MQKGKKKKEENNKKHNIYNEIRILYGQMFLVFEKSSILLDVWIVSWIVFGLLISFIVMHHEWSINIILRFAQENDIIFKYAFVIHYFWLFFKISDVFWTLLHPITLARGWNIF